MKKCFKCGQTKPLSDFYKHSGMKDGHLNKCKECNKIDVRKNRLDNVEYYREYDRIRFKNDPKIRERNAAYQKSEKGKESALRSRMKWLSRNKVKRAAHVLTGNAIRSGILKKQPCEICGSTRKIHAHHDDYMKPFEVRWLCPEHHYEWHKENGEGVNG